MLYINLEEKVIDKNLKFKFIRKKISKIKNMICKLNEEKNENIILITIPNVEIYTLKKLTRYFKINCVTKVCISNSLLKNKEFIDFLEKGNIEIFDGKWLFKHLISNCIEYVCFNKKENVGYQEISILTHTANSLLIEMIRTISAKVRVLNIVTTNEKNFKKLEKELYEEKGIILNINNNFRKSLIKSDIIFNFDFSEDELNTYSIPRKTCIINLSETINIRTKSFEGINVGFYEIQMPRKYLKNSLYLKNFNESILYESYIFKNTSVQNILNEIKNDGISVIALEGKNGKIRKNEYINLTKKIAN